MKAHEQNAKLILDTCRSLVSKGSSIRIRYGYPSASWETVYNELRNQEIDLYWKLFCDPKHTPIREAHGPKFRQMQKTFPEGWLKVLTGLRKELKEEFEALGDLQKKTNCPQFSLTSIEELYTNQGLQYERNERVTVMTINGFLREVWDKVEYRKGLFLLLRQVDEETLWEILDNHDHPLDPGIRHWACTMQEEFKALEKKYDQWSYLTQRILPGFQETLNACFTEPNEYNFDWSLYPTERHEVRLEFGNEIKDIHLPRLSLEEYKRYVF